VVMKLLAELGKHTERWYEWWDTKN